MSATLLPLIRFQALDDDGNPLPGAKLSSYEAGTSTPLATYSDSGLTTANANPVVADAGGLFGPIYLSPVAYKFILTDADDVTVWTQDNVFPAAATDAVQDIVGTAGQDLAVNDVVYLSAGDGALTAGRWYKADADNDYASSTAGSIGMVIGAVATGEEAAIRLSGRITGLSGMTAGAKQFVSATAGALTGTAPANARFVGVAESATVLVLQPHGALSSDAIAGGSITLGGVDNLWGLFAQAGSTQFNFQQITGSDPEVVIQGDLRVMVDLAVVNGTVIFSALPTSDPSVAGQLWNDTGTLKVSAG